MERLPDHYQTLGVLPDSEDSAIRSAYRALMQRYHPDTFAGDHAIAESKSKDINGAYEIIGHPERRKHYDAERQARTAAANQLAGAHFSDHRATRAQSAPDSVTPRGWAIIALVGLLAIIGMTIAVFMRDQTSVAANDASSDVLRTPVLISWQTDGSRRLYRADDLLITMFALQNPDSTDQTPVMIVKAPRLPPVEVEGVKRFQTAMASILIMRLDPASSENEVVLATSSGDAHCCTQLTILERWKGKWKTIDAGSWDGDVLSKLPQNIDGDKVPDFVFRDDRFNYAFAAYAESFPPPVIFNLLGGAFINVSKMPRYAEFFSREMTADQAGCLLHHNGACAAFVAIANRLGLHDWAWRYMLANYDRDDTWPLPESCGAPSDACATGTGAPDYPTSLAAFLVQHDYAPATESVQRPSFSCALAKLPALKLICSSPALAEADRDMAAAYLAALSTASQPDTLKDEQQKWIPKRNALQSSDELKQLYDQRTQDLTMLARMGAN